MIFAFNLIRAIFWNDPIDTIDRETYMLLKEHSIDALAALLLPSLQITDDLRKEWKNRIIQQVVYNTRCNFLEDHLPITVPYVILKGTSAAKYYPHPEYRAMGDIDIITPRAYFDQATQELLKDGYVISKELEREVGFVKDGIMVEMHHFFASLNDPEQAKYMDDLIIDNINPSHVLPDHINGLVLLEHINQHLEEGLGFRQIIDWMMFVDKCLSDEEWPRFQEYAKNIGLEPLAIVATKMCEIYLGLPPREWCNQADSKICKQLIDYIVTCGNFGSVRSENIGIGENVFYFGSTPKSFFGLLQKRGNANWKAAREHAGLRPFAWLYQIIRYAVKGFNREDAPAELAKEYRAAKQRIAMFEALGVRRSSKGLAVYRNGKYQKG